MHIAESVVNRILNAADELHASQGRPFAGGAVPMPSRAPSVPDTAVQGAQLDVQLATPPGELPPLDQAPDPGATADGAPLLDTLLTPGR